MAITFLSDDYWNNRYLTQETGWDLDTISPPLRRYFDSLVNKDIKILTPGAGYGHEAQYLHEQGFNNVHILDFAEEALTSFQKRVAGFPIDHLHSGDFFEHEGRYDLIIEQTFFCAIKPQLRPSYIDKMYNLLKPSGILAGLLFNIPLHTDHPPYGGHISEYKPLFSSQFEILEMGVTPHSVKPRAGNELFFRVRKAGAPKV